MQFYLLCQLFLVALVLNALDVCGYRFPCINGFGKEKFALKLLVDRNTALCSKGGASVKVICSGDDEEILNQDNAYLNYLVRDSNYAQQMKIKDAFETNQEKRKRKRVAAAKKRKQRLFEDVQEDFALRNQDEPEYDPNYLNFYEKA